MSLKSFLSSLPPEKRDAFAKLCGTSIGHLQNIGYGTKPCHPTLAARIETQSKGAVSRKELCPDIWRMTWPELTRRKAA